MIYPYLGREWLGPSVLIPTTGPHLFKMIQYRAEQGRILWFQDIKMPTRMSFFSKWVFYVDGTVFKKNGGFDGPLFNDSLRSRIMPTKRGAC